MAEQQQNQPQKPQPFFWGHTPEEQYYSLNNIKSSKSFYTSPRGLKLFTRSWLPHHSKPIKALIFMVHGYGNDISWTFQATPIFLAQHGYACFALDLEGHGQSEGLKAYVPNLDFVIDDCVSFLKYVVEKNLEFKGVKKFLFGESMGGAICLLMHLRMENELNGAVLVAPMCRISDKVRPIWPVTQFLKMFAKVAPTLAIVPSADLLEKSVKVEEKRIVAGMNPMRHVGKPRLGTVTELLRVTDCVSSRLCDVEIPFIVLHGNADVVTDPEVSKELYDCAKSADKSIKIYEGMLHSLLFGETDENVEIVRNDLLTWLNDRS